VDTKAKWLEHDPILLENEVAYEKESGKYKIGDGKTKWSSLPFAVSGEGGGSTGSGVGSATLQGGEIFNDYENNQATGLNSHASGNNTIAAPGLKFSEQEGLNEHFVSYGYNSTDERWVLVLSETSDGFFENNKDKIYGFRINNIGDKKSGNDRNYINIVKLI
jgi:hypothetical protein